MKYGTKYGADYVNKLFAGVQKNLKISHLFTCFTDDSEGLDKQIQVKPLRNQWQGWWSKVHIFDQEAYSSPRWVFYIDLDMIITSSLDELVSMHIRTDGMVDRSFTLATLSTNDIFCENVANGYNSSVVLFRTDRCHILYETLARYYKHLLRFLMRFDHYLEMLVWNAVIVQEKLPGQVVDYSSHFL